MFSLEQRRDITALICLYKIINNNIHSPEILGLIPFNVPSRNVCSSTMFNVPLAQTSSHALLVTMLCLVAILTF